jgi:hypothetical protein
MNCEYCGRDRESKFDGSIGPIELRPYGKRGEMICFDCGMLPENKADTEAAFLAQCEAAGPVVLIGEECGPRPFPLTVSDAPGEKHE